jgi:hypothetical protein
MNVRIRFNEYINVYYIGLNLLLHVKQMKQRKSDTFTYTVFKVLNNDLRSSIKINYLK